MDNIDTYYEELVSLSIQLDCTDDLRVRGAANKSARICNKLVKLREKIAESDIDRSELILKLLQHEHEKVRLTACTDGMVYGVHQELIKKNWKNCIRLPIVYGYRWKQTMYMKPFLVNPF